MNTDLILGTAGHIDHGKTSLVRALTGVDTDRLPEEKKRGITIDIGFAELVVDGFRLGIVDVPGHERFVRNMLAGATGVDLAMLVIAADDSIKPQTREHLEILRLLNLEAGVIVLTKCDLVTTDWLALVEDEIREFVAGTFLADAPIVHTSTVTQLGFAELKSQLARCAARVAESARAKRIAGPFRLAIDRTFTIAGHGTVVTGSVGSGRVRLGDELVIEPGGIAVRVRGLQNHDRTVDEIHRGQRAAINLAGVHHDEIQRGQELATPGHLVPSRLLTVWLSLLPGVQKPLKSRSRLKLHVGTAELACSVVCLDRTELRPGEAGLVQLFLNEPAVTTWNQPFVVRQESPAETIGGGQVLDPCAEKLRKPDETDLQFLRDLRSDDPLTRASAALFCAGLRDWKPADLARTAGIEDVEPIARTLRECGDLREISVSPTRKVRLHRVLFERLGQRFESALRGLHAENPLRSMLDRAPFVARFEYLGDPALVNAILDALRAAGRIRLSDRGIALEGCGPKLSKNEQKLLGELVERFRQAGLQSPTIKECQQQAARNQESVPQLIALATANGDLVEIGADYFLHADVERDVRRQLTEKMSDGRGLTLSEIRELLNTTRKYAVPLCEYFDRVGFTHRDGDVRTLAAGRSEVASVV